uniref:Uncharacterized protein n=1 Tax=Eptatretus burgeri TaxID=7764 RepID=A0A8C4QWW6_EPTBU
CILSLFHVIIGFLSPLVECYSTALLWHPQHLFFPIAIPGDAHVPVANCDQRQYDANPKQNMTLCWTPSIFWRGADIYSTPIHLSSDWLNKFAGSRQTDDYRFVHIGPKGIPSHHPNH